MTYRQALKHVEELRGRYKDFSASDKALIEQLYSEVLGKILKRTTCRDCYRDAYIEISTYLRREKKMREKCNYKLRAGFIIQDFNSGKIYTNANLTDKVAKAYLEKYPHQAKYFEVMPEEEEDKEVVFEKKNSKTEE